MRAPAFAVLLACAGLACGPAWGQAGGPSGNNHAVHNWNTNAFAVHPPANTNAFGTTPQAGTGAFAVHPPANTNAFAKRNGHPVTAFGTNPTQGTTNAFGNHVTATQNARRLAGSLATGNSERASPVGPNKPVNGNGANG